jgi:hypothetical protein
MSVGNISSPSPGPPASRSRRRGSPSPQGEGFLTVMLCAENEKAKAAALLPYRRIGVLEWASLCFHRHSRIVRCFSLDPRAVGVGLALPLVVTSGNVGDGKPSPHSETPVPRSLLHFSCASDINIYFMKTKSRWSLGALL